MTKPRTIALPEPYPGNPDTERETMIIQTVNESDFVRAFEEYNRAENFSVNARRHLFSYFDELSDETGEPFELDVIAICCEWSEYSTAVEAAKEYGWDDDADDDDDAERAAMAWLEYRTQVIECDDSVVIQCF